MLLLTVNNRINSLGRVIWTRRGGHEDELVLDRKFPESSGVEWSVAASKLRQGEDESRYFDDLFRSTELRRRLLL